MVVGVYTTSQIGKFDRTLPIGVIQVSPELAARTGEQKPFFIDVRKRAFIPFTRKFFPRMDEPQHGIIGPAGKPLSREIIRQFQLVNERYPELIVNVGPLRP